MKCEYCLFFPDRFQINWQDERTQRCVAGKRMRFVTPKSEKDMEWGYRPAFGQAWAQCPRYTAGPATKAREKQDKHCVLGKACFRRTVYDRCSIEKYDHCEAYDGGIKNE